MPRDAQQVSDALGPLVRWLAYVPDPVDLHLVCPTGPAGVPAARDAAAVRLPRCAVDLPVSVLLELVAAGARSLTVHGSCHPDPSGPTDPLPALSDARTLLAGAGRPLGADDGRPARRWARRRTCTVVDLDDLALPRRAVIAPVVGSRRYGARGRVGTERGRLLDVLGRLGLDPADLGRVQQDRLTGTASTGSTGAADDGAVRAGAAPAAGQVAVASPALDHPASPEPAVHEPGPTTDAEVPAAAGTGPTPPDPDRGAGAATPAASAVLTAGGCTACGTCVLTCPEGALTLAPRDGQAEPPDTDGSRVLLLTQEPASCTDCGACTAICPAGALTRIGTRDWAGTAATDRVTLATLTTRRCARCRAEYAPAADADAATRTLCPVCTDRRRSPFGSTVPTAATTITGHHGPRR